LAKKDYDKVREFLCSQRMDGGEEPKCLTSKAGKCPLAEFYCYEFKNANVTLENTPPNGRKNVTDALNLLAKEYGIEV
jgi:hypothetical protein